ncbi:MAG: hypothetical protein J6A08_00760 [Lachnospiraceae bacterium]|nr:hypothetical protein [Lachnospiraceae bacterium]
MVCDQLSSCIEQEIVGNMNHLCVNNNRDRCVKAADRRSKIQCEEKHKKYVLDNTLNNLVLSYKVDNGVIVTDGKVQEGTKKCDYLYIICEQERKAILIELKGVDVSKALKQMHATLLLFQDVFDKCTKVYGRIVVTSAFPNMNARPEYVNLVRILKKYHGNLRIVERQLIEKDIQLDKT